MKAHLLRIDQPACQKYSLRCLKGEYEILTLERFKKVLKKQKDYCCKKCINYLKNKK